MKRIIACLCTIVVFTGCKSIDSNYQPNVSFFVQRIDVSIPIESRIQDTPAQVISWLNNMDSTDTYTSHALTEEETLLFSSYAQLLPEKLKKVIAEKVIAVYFIDNFSGGGMTCRAFDNNGNLYMTLFFNPEILHRTMADWLNFRENSYFTDDAPDVSITVECTENYFALLHTLFHEASHVYDFYYHMTPYTEPYFRNDASDIKSDFAAMVWHDYNIPVAEYDFPCRNELYSYGLGPAHRRDAAFDIYASLAKTPFPTIYASSNWAEDFAESFTWFYLGVYFDCYYRVRISKNGEGKQETLLHEPHMNRLFTDRFALFRDITR